MPLSPLETNQVKIWYSSHVSLTCSDCWSNSTTLISIKNNIPWCKEASAATRAASSSSIRSFRVKMRSWWALSLRRSRCESSSSSLRTATVSSSRIHAAWLPVVLCVRFLRTSPAGNLLSGLIFKEMIYLAGISNWFWTGFGACQSGTLPLKSFW